MKHRMAIAVLSLLGFFLSAYLSMWKLGFVGPLVCGVGSCEIVQTSEYAYLLGIPVAFYGVAGYLAILVASLWGLQGRWIGERKPTHVIVFLAGAGVGFSIYLTFIEAFVLNAWCRWCVVSAIVITLILITGLAGYRESLSAHREIGE
ncbi:MAG: vitamin K epoxide reductase family protein [Gemmatimonadota bacterium]|nr:vitamin K epoxide reductase family protein [Gemmatimonadota bacterium]